ncbi:MAG TPA: shikimate dehydrogenase [Phycisphaerae bacterium]|nr:shikimate dehydrogenase [Phycisphaerae bacterium]
MLCVSLMPQTTDEALAGLSEAAAMADAAELRLDAMAEFDLRRILASPPCPVIVTYRPRREGGLYDGPEAGRLAVLRDAARLGARYIDVEHDAIDALGDVPPEKIILSYHNHEETPADLAQIHARLAETGAAVVKVAAMANHILDTVPVLRILRDATVPTIALSMGERGVLTRVLAPKFGALLTYAAPETGPEAAPGQVSARQMRDLYRVGRIGPQTEVYGVIADPVGHSMSPRIHNAAFAEIDYDAVYLPLWVEGDAAAFVRAMREFDFNGYSVTIPHKQTVMAAADQMEPLAARIGAVNTLQRRGDGSLFATNTDWTAGVAAIEAVVGEEWLRGKHALVIGAGGVGRAMAFGLNQRGAAVTLTDVDEPRAEALAAEVGVSHVSHADMAGRTCDVLLNCTPIGMHPKTDATAVPREMLRAGVVVYDAVYNPAETRLLREARDAGCRTVSGLDHFVRQAVEQFELWTNHAAPVETMRQVVIDALR